MFSALAFVLFAAACSVLAFMRHPVYGLCFYLGSIFVHPPSRWWGHMIPDFRWALLSAGIAVLAVLFHRGKLQSKAPWLSNGPAVILTLYALWMWTQSPWALRWEDHGPGTIQFTKYLVAFWLVYRVVDAKDKVRMFLTMHVIGCGLLGLYAYYTGRVGDRLDGVGGPGIDDANTLGMYLATGVMAALGLFISGRGWRRWAILGVMAFIVNGFVLANSRGAFVGLVAGGLVLAICHARPHRAMFGAFVLTAILGSSAVVDKLFIERMFTIGDVASDKADAERSAKSRVAISDAQLRMAADHPLGAGHKGTAALSPLYLEREWLVGMGHEADAERSSHNTFLTTLVEQGVVGAALYASLLLWIMAAVFRLRRLREPHADPELRTLGAALCAGLVVVHVAGIATDYLLAEVQFWLFAALVSVLQLAQSAARPSQAASVPPSRGALSKAQP